MQHLRVDTAGLQAMATRWAALGGELHATLAPAGLGLSCQASAGAVHAAHADITALGARVSTRATHVADADTRYLANETDSARELAALAPRVSGA